MGFFDKLFGGKAAETKFKGEKMTVIFWPENFVSDAALPPKSLSKKPIIQTILPRCTKCSLYPVKNSISAQEIQSASCTKRRSAIWQVCPYISSSSCSTSSIRVAQLVAMRTTVWVSSYFSQKPNLALPSSAANCSLDNTMNT